MPIQETIFVYTSTVAAVTALLGSGESCKLYWNDVADLGAPPYAVFSQSGESQAHRFGGLPSVSELTIRVDSYAITQDAARDIDKAIYDAWMNNAALFTAGVTVKAILHRNRLDMPYDDMAGLYCTQSEFSYWVDL